MSRLASELRKFIATVDAPLGSLAYPFPHPRGQLTILEYARCEQAGSNEWETVYRESESRLNRLFGLHYRLVGRFLVLAGSAEKDLELEIKDATADVAARGQTTALEGK
jgi:hypothetical protein